MYVVYIHRLVMSVYNVCIMYIPGECGWGVWLVTSCIMTTPTENMSVSSLQTSVSGGT